MAQAKAREPKGRHAFEGWLLGFLVQLVGRLPIHEAARASALASFFFLSRQFSLLGSNYLPIFPHPSPIAIQSKAEHRNV